MRDESASGSGRTFRVVAFHPSGDPDSASSNPGTTTTVDLREYYQAPATMTRQSSRGLRIGPTTDRSGPIKVGPGGLPGPVALARALGPLDNTVIEREDYRRRAVAEVKLREDVADVALHGCF